MKSKVTDLSLVEQLRITERSLTRRKQYFTITQKDCETLLSLRDVIVPYIDKIINDFYLFIIQFDEMVQLIGDSETLARLKIYQKNYILSLFDGQYDEDYISSRLRIGLIHNRIGVSPKLYISAVSYMMRLIDNIIIQETKESCDSCHHNSTSLEKIIMFDLGLVMDTYIHGLTDEVWRHQKELEEYSETLEEKVTERTDQLKQLAQHDGLTGLLNQRSFYENLRKELLRAQRISYKVSLVYLDLDGFKNLNDTKGHQTGDEILVKVATSLKQILRETDIPARYGGDEFCVILPDTDVTQAVGVCERLISDVKINTQGSMISLSIGIACSVKEKQLDTETLVKLADRAMYEAKKEEGFSIKIAASEESENSH